MATLQHVMWGIKSSQVKGGQQTRPRLPISPTILPGLRQVWEKSRHGFDNIMLWAACTTCFFGFLRSGEIAAPSAHNFDPSYHLTLGDIAVDNPSHPLAIRVCIKASKTDPFRKGVQIFLGRTGDHLCLVAALLAYVAIRGKQPGPLFCFVLQVEPISLETDLCKRYARLCPLWVWTNPNMPAIASVSGRQQQPQQWVSKIPL